MARLVIDQPSSFAAVLFMGCQPKQKFVDRRATGEQDATKDGIPKWSVQVSIVDRQTSLAETLKVSINQQGDPAQGLALGTPVSFESLEMGLMNGNAFFVASGLRSNVAAPARSAKSEG